MKALLFLALSFLNVGCLVAHKEYVESVNGNKSQINDVFKRGNINFSCEIAPGDNKFLTVYLWFDEKIVSKKIEDLVINLYPQDKSNLELVKVDFTQAKNIHINPNQNSKYFNDLPSNLRLTSFEGSRVLYSFEFKSENKINSKYMRFSYAISLENNTVFKDEIDLTLVTTHHLAVH